MRIVLALVLSSVLLHAQASEACTCAPPDPPLDALHDADAVFGGKVVNVITTTLPSGTSVLQVELLVAEVWKGPVQAKITVESPLSAGSCGVDFWPNQEFLVYANDVNGVLKTHLCTRTRLRSDAKDDLVVLGAGTVPPSDLGTPVAPSAPDLAVPDSTRPDLGQASDETPVPENKTTSGSFSTTGCNFSAAAAASDAFFLATMLLVGLALRRRA